MASRAAQQDSFIEEEEESCPLCVEEFDLSDKNFKPCPCGFQICQFCFNKIRETGSGLCPACRRAYDEKTIQWKVVSPEEFKAETQKQNRKKEEARRKEAQKREFESLNRKHLSGLRVVQKNLVYVVGLNPRIREDELHSTLRGDQYFGQYGKIIKIVVSKPKEGTRSDQSLGVYVTFERNEDADNCIKAVDGSRNGDRTLKAQFGTTKYCSAYLRNETCQNKSCMFLHEAGEDKDSFTREGLSSKNTESAQPPPSSVVAGPSSRYTQSQTLPQKPAPAAATGVVASAARRPSREGRSTSEEDGSALPSSASWANKNAQAPSVPTAGRSTPAKSIKSVNQDRSANSTPPIVKTETPPIPKHALDVCLEIVCKPQSRIRGDRKMFSEQDCKLILDHPPMWSSDGGDKLLAARAKEAERILRGEDPEKSLQENIDKQLAGGSLQLGGEPDHPSHDRDGQDQRQLLQSSTTPIGANFGSQKISNLSNLSNLSINGRGLTQLQQQQLLQMKSSTAQSPMDQLLTGLGGPYGQSSQQYAGAFQSQPHTHHARGLSRYSFANDTASSTTNVKPAANPKAMAQQASMMPSAASQAHHNPAPGFGGSGMPGPPPGLKAAGTPPISGGGMFGQGHGFTSNIPRNITDKENQPDMLRDIFRGRGGVGTGGQGDSGKREFFSPFSTAPFPSSLSSPIFGPQPGSGLVHHFSPRHDESAPFKSKRKGKKHRHANTSSSGGSGIVDLADPTILQARMQQQQPQNTTSGQGLYGGGQGQGGYNSAPYGNGFASRW